MHSDAIPKRARHLIKSAQQAGKPLRVFLGYRAIGNCQYALAAYDDATNVCKSLPRSEITVTPDMPESELVAALVDGWAALELQPKKPDTRAPKRNHAWMGKRG